jgi:glycosyltransferase involved in cell wall biosynthesis
VTVKLDIYSASRRARPLFAALARLQPRRISAMLRVHNEEELLAAALRSIADLVDEIVCVDNRSTDRTPEILRDLAAEFPGKTVVLGYDHAVARVGGETRRLAETASGRRSPSLSANFYEWCRKRLRHPYALKWDADMVALPELADAVRRWRAGRALGLVFSGANLHSDRRHLAKSRSTDREALAARLRGVGLPRWVTALERDAPEPRLFPRHFVRYTTRIGWTQSPDGPFRDAPPTTGIWQREEAPQFLHLKFWKRDPYSNYTDDLAAVIAGNLAPGELIPEKWRGALERHELAPREAS